MRIGETWFSPIFFEVYVMNFDYQLVKLSPLFYKNYNNSKYNQILTKSNRVYTCLLIDFYEDYFICIPYRTHMNRKNGFLFKGTKRSKNNNSGLDYEKLIVVKHSEYIDDSTAIIDNDEYRKTVKNINKIACDVLKYVNTYVEHVKQIKILSEKQYTKKYCYTTLKYFHSELGIE